MLNTGPILRLDVAVNFQGSGIDPSSVSEEEIIVSGQVICYESCLITSAAANLQAMSAPVCTSLLKSGLARAYWAMAYASS